MRKNYLLLILFLTYSFISDSFAQNNDSKFESVPETDVVLRSFINGNNPSGRFGFSIATGDFNGDGFSDFLASAPTHSSIGSNRGRVYLYLGGENYDFVPDLIIDGYANEDQFGICIANTGDVNGDGFPDFLIGANLNDSNGINSGRAYLYFGGSVLNNTPDVIFTGEATGDNFGFSLSSAGDVNGDGYADVIIGANLNDATFINAGRVYLYYGGPGMNNVADLVFSGFNADDEFGFSISSTGDYNGDGFNDIIIGSPMNDDAGNNAGAAYVYYEGSTMNNEADRVIYSGTDDDRLGSAVSDAGDFNGDGYGDFIVGIPRADNNMSNSGIALLYLGGSNPSLYSAATFYGTQTNSFFGSFLKNAGDFNGDGYSDVIISSLNYFASTGRSIIYFGSEIVNNTADVIANGSFYDEYLGKGLAGTVDLDGDGNSEILIGANGFNDFTGRVYIYKQKMTGNDLSDETFFGQQSNSYFGTEVSVEGDINGDGYNDIVVSAPGYSSNKGRVYVFYGGSLLDNNPDKIFEGENFDDYFGHCVSSAGDINNDGFDDIMIGARGFDNFRGKVYVYLGQQNMDTVADRTYIGTNTGDEFGYKITMGRVNTDFNSDYIITAPKRSSGLGVAYYYFGSTSINSLPTVLMTGEISNSYFGISADIIGDVNGDLFGDILIGAHSIDSGKGKAYLYYGNNNFLPNSQILFKGSNNTDYFGFSVSKAGDVNKDGFMDFIIGSPGANSGMGKALLYHGGPNMTGTPILTFNGTNQNENFGFIVKGGGDLNNDGFSDIGICSPYYIYGLGKINFYFGSHNMDNISDLYLIGTENDGDLGLSLSMAGDVNGDNMDDFSYGYLGYSSGSGLAKLNLSTSTQVNPRILAVSDVPNDQGGFVKIKFTRSGYDYLNMNMITHYQVERSDPPGTSGFAWQTVYSQTANNNSLYNLNISTPSDSNSNGNSTFFYRVVAKTSNGSVYWRSNILSGSSIDNLAPLPPVDLMASGNSNSIKLNWQPNIEPDLKKYLIFKNDVFYKESLTNNLTDTNVVQDSIYIYKVAAQDVNGNISELSMPDTASLESITLFDVTVIPEGLLNISTNTLRMRDTISAYLYDITGSDIIDSAKGILDSVNFTVDLEFKNAISGVYYLVIKHRNCIETWSKLGGEKINRGDSYIYDFTNSPGSAYGDNLKLKGGKYCLYSGDVNSSGVINSTDRTLIRNNVGQIGYIRFDLDGNGVVNSSDRTIVRNNTGISRQRP
ncbi:MAG TPA: FG-GAP-like repeat-containing protein [Ignavibacteria bacterium]|nr:FG-GAP-like repeat-containing protein [Ignavibacteria bacterium]